MEYRVSHVYREGNVVADFLAKRGVERLNIDWYADCNTLPSQLHGLFRMDKIGLPYLYIS